VTDGDGRVVLAGQVAIGADASFRIDLRGRLPVGHFTLAVQLIVNANAMNAEIRRIPVEVGAKP
jgi:hypothetical protein